MSNSGKRVSGFELSTTVEQLEIVSAKMADQYVHVKRNKEGKVVDPNYVSESHRVIKPIEVYNSMISNFNKEKGGLVFLDGNNPATANKIIIVPKAIERTGGNDNIKFGIDGKPRRSEISEIGNWYHYSAGNTEYRAEIPIDIYRESPSGVRVKEIFAGGTGEYMLNIQGSTAQKSDLKIWISAIFVNCLNGMTGQQTLFMEHHKHTAGLNLKTLLRDALYRASCNYHTLNSDVDNLRNAEVTPEKLGLFFHSAIMNNVISGGNVKEITENFQNTVNNEWFDDKDINGLRLYNSVTLFGEKIKSIPARSKLAGDMFYPLADAGIVPLPKSCTFRSGFKKINSQPVSDSGIVPETEILVDPRQIDLEGIPFRETVETELVS